MRARLHNTPVQWLEWKKFLAREAGKSTKMLFNVLRVKINK